MFVGILFMDMFKVFDLVYWFLLLSKFKFYGFNDSFVYMLNSYCYNRLIVIIELGWDFL